MCSLSEHAKAYRDQLDSWINSLGLSVYRPEEDEIDRILRATKSDLRQTTSVQLCEDCFMMYQYAIFIQQKSNECQAFLKWSDQINGRIAGDDRSKLLQWTRKARLRDIRISYLTRKIESLAQSIRDLVRARHLEGSADDATKAN